MDIERDWDDLFPYGRVVFYEGDDPNGFASEMAALKIDVRAIPDMDLTGYNPLDWDGSCSFYIPPGRVQEIYGSGRWRLGS